MNIDAHTLTLVQMLSPAYPVGSFAYSHGLESAISTGQVNDDVSLNFWLEDVLKHGSGCSDAILLQNAYAAQDTEALSLVDETACAFAASGERLREAERQGAAFARTTADVWQIVLPALQFPVAVGRVAKILSLPLTLTTAMYLQSFMANLISAAVRLVPLGQTEGQRVLAGLTPHCHHVAVDCQGETLDGLFSNAFLSDVAAMRHETLQPRLFQS